MTATEVVVLVESALVVAHLRRLDARGRSQRRASGGVR